jgi:Flp pilus assembly protein TadD
MNRNPQEALAHFERAAELQPERSDIHFTMAAVHAQLGNEDEAVAQLQETLRLAPNHAGAREALTLIMKQRSQ